MTHKTISIVTPTFNQGRYIEQTIESVLSQGYPNLEYIIIDGGSTDNTVEIIKKFEKHLKYWVSEKDKGQANAINKGLKLCSGEIFNWLNSDDYLEQGALQAIEDGFASGADVVAGKTRIFREDKTLEMVQHSNLSSRGLMCWDSGVQFVQPGVWLKKSLIERCGGIDESLHYSFDWDMYIRYLSKYSNVKYIEDLLIHFRYHELSKTVKMQNKFLQEQNMIVEKLAGGDNSPELRKLALYKLKINKWMPFLREVVNNDELSKLIKFKRIVKGVNIDNLQLWRATGGALNMVLKNQKYKC